MAKRYTVRAAPGISEHLGTTYLMVKGPDVTTFVTMERIAALLEATLNAAVAFTEPPNATPKGNQAMNRIVKTPDGYDVVVDGVQHGTWRSRSEASAGMATEVARAKERDDAESERLIAKLQIARRELERLTSSSGQAG